MSQDSGQQTPVPLEDALAVAEKLQPAFNKLTVLFQRCLLYTSPSPRD